MRLISANKLAIVALIVAVLTVVTGVTWAANSGQDQDLRKVELQIDNYKVQQGGNLDVIGAGFDPGETVLVQIFRMQNGINPIVGGGSRQRSRCLPGLGYPSRSYRSRHLYSQGFGHRRRLGG